MAERINNIQEGISDIFYIFRNELKKVMRDSGVMIFFFLVPFGYPLAYSFIYNNETVHDSKMVVVDQDNSALSREFIRRIDATPDVHVVATCPDLNAAKKMLDEKKAYGILTFPTTFSKEINTGKQTHVSLYSDMSCLLYYKAFLLSTTEVSFDMGDEINLRHSPVATVEQEKITTQPVPYESIALFNPKNGFASFLVPAILMLVIQQTLILGICMLGGTARERNRFHCLVPISKHFNGTLRIILGKGLTYFLLYGIVCLWTLAIVPRLFHLPQMGEPITIVLFIIPYVVACICFAMTLSGFMTSRESPMLIFVFTSVLLLFISGVSWPEEGMPLFWRILGFIFPSTMGIQGFIHINTEGATLNQVAWQYHTLWLQAGIYFITAFIIYRYQIIRTHRKLYTQYRYMKMQRMLRQEEQD